MDQGSKSFERAQTTREVATRLEKVGAETAICQISKVFLFAKLVGIIGRLFDENSFFQKSLMHLRAILLGLCKE